MPTVARSSKKSQSLRTRKRRLGKPHGYWTLEKVAIEAKKYTSRHAFENGSSGAYDKALSRGWINRVCRHMKPIGTPKGFWSYERVLRESKKFATIQDFRKYSPNAHVAALRNGYEKILESMTSVYFKRGHWTFAKVKAEAEKYKTRTEFSEKCAPAYRAAQRKKWLKRVCKHMVSDRYQKGFWSEKELRKRASQYQSKAEFRTNDPQAYDAAFKKNLIDKICSHMAPVGSRKRRGIYYIEFSDGSVYVGLTYSFERRLDEHRQSTTIVGQKIRALAHQIILSQKYFPAKEAVRRERAAIKRYKKAGWKILNSVKGGSLGGTYTIWTKDAVLQEAKKHLSVSLFAKNASGAYDAAKKNGWLKVACKHMIRKSKPRGYWTLDRVRSVAKKYKTRKSFAKSEGAAYTTAQRKGWLSDVCSHMHYDQLPRGYWSKSRIIEAAEKFDSRTKFKYGSPTAHGIARKNKWLDEICAHMEKPKRKTA